MRILLSMELGSLKNTIRKLEQQGESLGLVLLKLELRNRHLKRPRKGGPLTEEVMKQRFWSKVLKAEPDKCWNWTGGKTSSGYGMINFRGIYVYSHRMSAMIHGMDIFGKHVCHKCDNPPCVNPSHLFVGTTNDNMMDAWVKGRIKVPPPTIGEDNHFAKLKESDVIQIRSSSLPSRKLGKMYGVSKTNILRIKNGIIWSHVQ